MAILSNPLQAIVVLLTIGAIAAPAQGGPPLHEQIDALVDKGHAGPWADPADDSEFVRRVYLDLAGQIPTADEARAFLTDTDAQKRTKLIDRLLAAPEFANRMADAFSVMLVERRPGGPITDVDWKRYLRESLLATKPWDQIAREIVAADGLQADTRPAMMFILARGAESYDLLTRDVGRLLLGIDLQCAKCHDHPSIKDYKQSQFFGIQAFLSTTGATEASDNKELLLVQKSLAQPLEFKSVFTGATGTTGPQLPGRSAVAVPAFATPEEGFSEHARIRKPGMPKFFARGHLAQELAGGDNPLFARNIANRVWAALIGRGLVEPLDLHHSDNPPSHPELLDLLAAQIVDMKFDIRQFVREVVLTRAYQRSSLLPKGSADLPPQTLAVANIKHLSAEQLHSSLLRATGQVEIVRASIDEQLKAADAGKYAQLQADPPALERARDGKWDELRKTFVAAFANPPGEPEDEFSPTLTGALFFANEKLLAQWLTPQPGNLIDRLAKFQDPNAAVDEMYLAILSRQPSDEERAAAVTHVNSRGDMRADALGEVAWGLLASSEFRLNH